VNGPTIVNSQMARTFGRRSFSEQLSVRALYQVSGREVQQESSLCRRRGPNQCQVSAREHSAAQPSIGGPGKERIDSDHRCNVRPRDGHGGLRELADLRWLLFREKTT
jgi:hypothetical protein